ncbi:MAG: phosphatase PAP2 family protein [Bacteroidia bacterium]|nr:phosphatase PAP2 family protein [Bacteroidia bacterium]MDW8015988.1 phosphatase PAP2 family protein [Bacteroidia bacterium]
MTEMLKSLDVQLLLWINSKGGGIWDMIMWYGTKGWAGLPLYCIGVLWAAWRHRDQLLRACLTVIIAVGLSDFFSSRILKPLIGRQRPSHDPALLGKVRLIRGYKGGLYSFPSGHASNTTAGVVAFAGHFRSPFLWTIGLSWVAFHSLTRVYLGVHYPGDIIGGWLFGSLIGIVLLAISKRIYA